MNIVIPMAGEGSRFVKAGFEKPKPFIDVEGLPMIERVMENLNYQNAHFILIGRKDHLEKEKKLVNKIINKYDAEFIAIDKLTEGTACTVLFAKKQIDNDYPLLIANSDQIVDIEIADFINDCLQRNLDGSILTFKDEELNPKWSFAKTDASGIVQEVKEKEAISNNATVGIYLFAKGSDYVDAAIQMIIENDRVNNEFYTCPSYNYAIRDGKNIGVYDIPFTAMHGIGTPEDLDVFLKKNRT
ncbi:lipopolysaccharide biosynthesis protein [Pedobacter chinensis]|uniref:Lipopolysaccharide biosynthesis protein n=1 Tax=Pedobacter chinensis TaxID=2282421 RepID=A0A369PTM6_9SPHI|nr:lipopolysaccharide biosynthesis protein [Pedobacter chinensis]